MQIFRAVNLFYINYKLYIFFRLFTITKHIIK